MYPRDTIAAIATAVGPAAVAIVRVSGVDAALVARHVFRGRALDRWESHRLYAGRFVDEHGQTVDRGLAVIMRAPRSYTGEDVVELHGHGGAIVARRLLAAVLAAGARAAERGEFTLRAFVNGKLDLAQAEAVADLIMARTDGAMRVALDHLGGALSRTVEVFRERLVGIAAQLEVAIDFSAEDVGEFDRGKLASEAAAVAASLRELAASHACGRLLRDGLRVAIVGKPNVGKSSLLNRLLGAERAIVTPLPGTTRDVIEETLDIGGLAVSLTDTAGLRNGSEEIERIGIGRTLDEIQAADVAVVVFDHASRFTDEDEAVLNSARHRSCILVINKVDLPRVFELPASRGESFAVVRLSAKTGEGIEGLRHQLVRVAGLENTDTSAVTVTRERQRSALDAAAAAAERAAESLRFGLPPEVVGVDIMVALDNLGEIVGRTSPEAVLDRIFSEFCIGK